MGLFDMFSKAKGNSEEKASELISKAPVGQAATELSSQVSCADVFTIEPKPLDVGIPRAKALKGRVVVLGRIKGGEFAKGDAVAVVKNGTVSAHTKILDLIPLTQAIRSGLGKAFVGKLRGGFGYNVYKAASSR